MFASTRGQPAPIPVNACLPIGVSEFFKVFEASGCQAATGSAAVGWLIQAWVGSARIFGSAVVEKRSG